MAESEKKEPVYRLKRFPHHSLNSYRRSSRPITLPTFPKLESEAGKAARQEAARSIASLRRVGLRNKEGA